MILYLDTSALIKRYFKEPFTKEVVAKWEEAQEIVTSSVAYAESMAVFYRKKSESVLDDAIMEPIVSDFREDWQSFIRIQVTDELNAYIDKAIASHPLRGFDAIHLASAMVVHEKFQTDLVFSCFDQKLSQAAQIEGIRTFPV